MGTDDFYHKRKKTRTTAKKKVEQKAVLIALEDTKSSKYYFEGLIKDKGLTGQVIFAKHQGTNPKNVLNAIDQHLEVNKKIKYSKKWIVIDKDDWSLDELNGVISSAKANEVCVALSNESYELWLLLHFKPITRYMSRVDLNCELREVFQERFGMDYEKSIEDIYPLTVGLQKAAIVNAKNLVTMHQRNHGKINPIDMNPLTMIYQLVECLNSLYEAKQECDCFP